MVSLSLPKPVSSLMAPQSFTPTPTGLQSATPPQQHPSLPGNVMHSGPAGLPGQEVDYTKIRINHQLPLFQKRPELTCCVQTAIESATSGRLGKEVVVRSITMTLVTAENIIKKDFSLDQEESRMRMAAQYMVRHIAVAAVLIYARAQISTDIISRTTWYRTSPLTSPSSSLPSKYQEVEEAANCVTADNLEAA